MDQDPHGGRFGILRRIAGVMGGKVGFPRGGNQRS